MFNSQITIRNFVKIRQRKNCQLKTRRIHSLVVYEKNASVMKMQQQEFLFETVPSKMMYSHKKHSHINNQVSPYISIHLLLYQVLLCSVSLLSLYIHLFICFQVISQYSQLSVLILSCSLFCL